MHHLTENQRLLLTAYLDGGLAITAISRHLKLSADRIRREIGRYLLQKKKENGEPLPSDGSAGCERLKKSPHICNGCPLNSRCLRPRIFYNGYDAHQIYLNNLKNCRKKSHGAPGQLHAIAELILNGRRNGESIHHIITTHPELLPCSEKTVYNYISRNLIPGVLPPADAPGRLLEKNADT